jgi:hypothetical protein
MVWKNTQSMGIGSVVDSDERVCVVCTYNPPGNIGDFQRNVLPATKVRINKNPWIVRQQGRTLTQARDSRNVIPSFYVAMLLLLHNAVHYMPPMPFADIVCSG